MHFDYTGEIFSHKLQGDIEWDGDAAHGICTGAYDYTNTGNRILVNKNDQNKITN